MLSPEYLDKIADGAVEVYQEMQDAVCREIAKALADMDSASQQIALQARYLQENGALYGDIVKKIAEHSGKAEDEIRKIFGDALTESIASDTAIFLRAGKPIQEIKLTGGAATIFEATVRKVASTSIARCVEGLRNLTLTMASTSSAAYIEAASLASLEVSNGLANYRTAIPRAIESVAQKGLTVSYPSGHVDSIETATKRAVLTGVNQTAGEISKMMADEFQCDLMEITAHANARPSHAAWQGKVVSLSGRKGYLSLDDIGYGTGAGFMGWNCRHNWNPYFEGISKPAWSKEELDHLEDKTVQYNGKMYSQYEISQVMREKEREIRQQKRVISSLFDASQQQEISAALKESITKKIDDAKTKLSDMQSQYKVVAYAKGNINSTATFRRYAYGYDNRYKEIAKV